MEPIRGVEEFRAAVRELALSEHGLWKRVSDGLALHILMVDVGNLPEDWESIREEIQETEPSGVEGKVRAWIDQRKEIGELREIASKIMKTFEELLVQDILQECS